MDKVLNNLDRGLEFGNKGVGRWFAGRYKGRLVIRYFDYRKYNVSTEVYDSVDELVAAMREIQRDLRKWELAEVGD